MRDFAVSESPEVQAQLDRLGALSLPKGRLGLEVIHALLARLGNPQHHLPPVLHVAGTNGKGSTCAFLTAVLEAAGLVVHSATKPHLVRYNERIRLAGKLIDDDALAALLAEVLDAGEDLEPSFFEVTTAATFLAYARVPADACVIEVGLGGRFDATNVLQAPAACGIASLGIDHEGFLLVPEEGTPQVPIARIAFEKAGIARANAPLVTQSYPPEASAEIEAAATRTGALLAMRGVHWWAEVRDGALHYRDGHGTLTLPLPALPGAHQADNAALAVAMLRHQTRLTIPEAALAEGIRKARWPARLQELGPGPLTARLPGRRVLVDGGHNPDAAEAVARALADQAPVALVFGLMANRPLPPVLGPLAGLASSLHAVPLPGHECHAPGDIAAFATETLGIANCQPAETLEQALAQLAARPDGPPTVLIAGSLYLAGQALRLNDEIPD
jgi:dihydrofolate synthase/folylpolyglutamate synthase